MTKNQASRRQRVPTHAALVKALTVAVKQHLLANGVEPAIVNEGILKTALVGYNATLANSAQDPGTSGYPSKA